MDEAYFVGRREILEWINGMLQLPLGKIEETASGCVALQLMDVCYPGQVNLHKVVSAITTASDATRH
jgi:microtubule-associated protein, RP/EB family